MSDNPVARVYEFGPFRLDPGERLLSRDHQPVALTPKAFDMLVCLVERHGRLVEKQTLMASLWPDAVVEEANLAYTVSAVRRALGGGQDGEQFIQTVPTRGYRFVAPVSESSRSREPRPLERPRRSSRRIAPALAAGVLLGGLLGWELRRPQPMARPVVRFEIAALPDIRHLSAPAFSPDGRRLVYVSAGPEGQQLYLRSLDSTQATALEGTADARNPFFSPDGTAVGFFMRETLKKVDLVTGHVTTVCSGPGVGVRGGAWSTANRIYFPSTRAREISVVSANGGKPEAVTKMGREGSHAWPQLLPGERHLLFTTWDTDVVDDGKVEVVSLENGERETLLTGGFGARYVPTGHLMYVRRGSLMAIAFDPETMQVKGTETKVMEGISVLPYTGVASFAVSHDGTLAYFPGGPLWLRSEIVWMTMTGGAREPVAGPPGFYVDPVVSPDGRHLAAAPLYGIQSQDVWAADLARSTWMRLTVTGGGVAPVWHPADPNSIVFTIAREGRAGDLFSAPVDASRPPELIYESPYHKFATSSAPGARLVAFVEVRPDTKADVWLLQIDGKPIARPFLQTAFWEGCPALSPDGRRLAYESDESGRREIYVRPVSGEGRKWQLSGGGGDRPRWSRDGRQIVYRNDKRMMAVNVAAAASFDFDTPRVLFEGEFEAGGFVTPNYDISPDGKRLLMIEPSRDVKVPSQLVIVENWLAEVRQKLGPQ